jgi:hypothetical protein
MRKIFTTATLFLLTFESFAQMRTISGTLTSNDGSPLPGINIVIKGTTVGTTTDINGYYSIGVPVGETLVFSFIGMQTREIVVTRDNFKSTANSSKKSKDNKKRQHYASQPIPRSLYNDSISENVPGVSVLTDKTPSYNRRQVINPSTVKSIKKSRSGYTIVTDDEIVKLKGFGLQISSSFGIERINKLPALHAEYSQGRPRDGYLQWQGPEYGEPFSWGPPIRTLEYDGNNYPYDINGRLVPAGAGNGKKANIYNPRSFFRNGSTAATEVTVAIPGPRNGTFIFDAEARVRNSVIPNSWYKRFNFSGSLRSFKITDDLRATASASFNNSSGNLLRRGSNYAAIIGSVYRTPASFDNANHFPANKAFDFQESYQLPDGGQRSHAPGIVDNPNGLVSELPGHEDLRRIAGAVNFNYMPSSPFSITLNANIDDQRDKNIVGIPPGYSSYAPGRFSERNDANTFINAILTPTYHFYEGASDFKLSVSYHTQYEKRNLNRHDAFGLMTLSGNAPEIADSTVYLSKTSTRSVHEILLNAYYEYNEWLNVRLTNRSYFSSTLKDKAYTNVFPGGSVTIDVGRLLYLGNVDNLKLYASLGQTIRESPLIYSDWAYGSTATDVSNYNTFFEGTEVFFDPDLLPETERKFETGIKFSGLNGLRIALTYFRNRTDNFIAPTEKNEKYILENTAIISNYGGSLTGGYYRHSGDITWGTDIVWSKHNSIVDELYGAEHIIPLAGFSTVQTVMALGKPLGAIYGSTYKRNDEGKKIIGSDGFPIEDHSPKMIGNPIPDWTLGWSSFIRWKQLKLSFLFDFKRGGDIWNGTNAALDYLGKSAKTGRERNIANYVFDGVDVNGDVNSHPVTFADPTRPINENKWVRYGWDGVGEEYIENSSWVRLNELSISYSVKQWFSRAMKEISFTVTGHNLFVITPYTGVDPSSTLFGYSLGNGLDLFNAPATRRFSAQITIKI